LGVADGEGGAEAGAADQDESGVAALMGVWGLGPEAVPREA